MKYTIITLIIIGIVIALIYSRKKFITGITKQYEEAKAQIRKMNSEIILGPAPQAQVTEVNLNKNFQEIIDEKDPKTEQSFWSSINPVKIIIGSAPTPQFKDKQNE